MSIRLCGTDPISLKSIRILEEHVKLWDLIPGNELLNDRDANEACLAVDPGQVYVVFFTDGGEVGLNLLGQKAEFKLQWLDIGKSTMTRGQRIMGGYVVKLDAPEKGLWLAVLKRN